MGSNDGQIRDDTAVRELLDRWRAAYAWSQGILSTDQSFITGRRLNIQDPHRGAGARPGTTLNAVGRAIGEDSLTRTPSRNGTFDLDMDLF